MLKGPSTKQQKKIHEEKVRELGTPTMPLPNPDMATKKATFGMS